MNDKRAIEIGTEVHQSLIGMDLQLQVSFDGGKSWGAVGAVAPDVEALLMSHRDAAGVENKQIRIYSSMSMSGSFTFKPKKPRKARQTPPFWSAYR